MGHSAQFTVQLGICTSKNIPCYLIDLISLQHRALDSSHQALGGVFAGSIPPYKLRVPRIASIQSRFEMLHKAGKLARWFN